MLIEEDDDEMSSQSSHSDDSGGGGGRFLEKGGGGGGFQELKLSGEWQLLAVYGLAGIFWQFDQFGRILFPWIVKFYKIFFANFFFENFIRPEFWRIIYFFYKLTNYFSLAALIWSFLAIFRFL